MTISSAVIWLIAGLLLLGAEMLTGGFYFLVFGLSCFVSALLAWLDLSVPVQGIAAGVMILAGSCCVFYLKRRCTHKEADSLNNMDAGQLVTVSKVKADGTATVNYRGTMWQAYARTGELRPGLWQIVAVNGPRLMLQPAQTGNKPPLSPAQAPDSHNNNTDQSCSHKE